MKDSKVRKIGKTVAAIGAEGITEIKNQGMKTLKEIKEYALKAYECVKDNLEFKKAFNEASSEFEIVGTTNILSQPLKIRGFVLNNHEVLFKYDDREIKRIISGALLKNNEIQIKIISIDNKKQINHLLNIDDEEYIVPCFKAKYKQLKK